MPERPDEPRVRNLGPRARERRVGGRAEEGGGGAPAEPVACAPVPPGRLLRREPEPPGGRDSAEDNEEEAARRAEGPGSPAPEAPGITPDTGPRFVRLSRVSPWTADPCLRCIGPGVGWRRTLVSRECGCVVW